MIAVFFIRIATIIAVFTKMSYIWVLMRIATMVAVLTKRFNFFIFLASTAIMIAVLTKRSISESVLTEDCDHESQFIRPPCPLIPNDLEYFPGLNTNKTHREHKQNEICKKIDPPKKFPKAPPLILGGGLPAPLSTPIATWPHRLTHELLCVGVKIEGRAMSGVGKDK